MVQLVLKMLNDSFSKSRLFRIAYFIFTLVILIGLSTVIKSFWIRQSVIIFSTFVLLMPLIKWLESKRKNK